MIVLRRKVKIQSYEAFLHYMCPTNSREDILSFLTLVRERETIDAKTVNRDFFMKKAENHCFGQRYIMSISELGLMEPAHSYGSGEYRLTDLGSKAVEEGEVFIPASGSRLIHLTDDPLFGYPLLALEEMNGQEKKKNNGSKDPIKESENPVEKSALVEAIESSNPHRLYAMKGERVIVNEVDKYITPNNNIINVKVEIHVDEEKPLRTLIAVRDEKPYQIDIDVNIEYVDVMREAFNERMLDVGGTSLILSFSETKPEERASFTRMLPKTEIDMGELGNFEATWNSGVAIRPRDQHDAAEWIDEAILSSITSFIDEDGYEELRGKAIARFNCWFSESQLDGLVMTYDELIQRSKTGVKAMREVQWYVMAPIDLIGGA